MFLLFALFEAQMGVDWLDLGVLRSVLGSCLGSQTFHDLGVLNLESFLWYLQAEFTVGGIEMLFRADRKLHFYHVYNYSVACFN